MLSIDSKLDYDTMRQICLTGHSRVPVYEEIEVAVDTSGRLQKYRHSSRQTCMSPFPTSRTHLTLVLVRHARPQK